MEEMLVWRPVMAKLVNLVDIHSGAIDLVDLLKFNALLDMQATQFKGNPSK